MTRLHANELPWRSGGDESMAGLNRYPEPQARAVIERLSALYQVPPEQLLICRGSDEAIDLLTRAFCRPHEDAVLVCPPTFGMYATAALHPGSTRHQRAACCPSGASSSIRTSSSRTTASRR